MKQGDFWFCPDCWNSRGEWRKLHEADCSCGFKWEGWFYDFGHAYCHALKLAKEGHFDFEDGCCLCTEPTRIGPLALCKNCGKQTSFGHEIDVLGFFVDPNADLSRLTPNPDIVERVRQSKP